MTVVTQTELAVVTIHGRQFRVVRFASGDCGYFVGETRVHAEAYLAAIQTASIAQTITESIARTLSKKSK